jgi:hypothetical protein
MIASETVADIRRLLAERKHTHREIAAWTGVSRGSVGAIALGRRRLGDPLAPDDGEPPAAPVRCAGCGALVYLPCVLCGLQGKQRRGVAEPRKLGGVEASADLDLRPDHRTRYEEVRCHRREIEEMERQEKGDSPHLPERPGGCFAQMGTVPLFPGTPTDKELYTA